MIPLLSLSNENFLVVFLNEVLVPFLSSTLSLPKVLHFTSNMLKFTIPLLISLSLPLLLPHPFPFVLFSSLFSTLCSSVLSSTKSLLGYPLPSSWHHLWLPLVSCHRTSLLHLSIIQMFLLHYSQQLSSVFSVSCSSIFFFFCPMCHYHISLIFLAGSPHLHFPWGPYKVQFGDKIIRYIWLDQVRLDCLGCLWSIWLN